MYSSFFMVVWLIFFSVGHLWKCVYFKRQSSSTTTPFFKVRFPVFVSFCLVKVSMRLCLLYCVGQVIVRVLILLYGLLWLVTHHRVNMTCSKPNGWYDLKPNNTFHVVVLILLTVCVTGHCWECFLCCQMLLNSKKIWSI